MWKRRQSSMNWSKLWEYGHTARKSSRLHWIPASSCFTSSLSTACNHPDTPNMLVSHNTYQMVNEHLETGLCGKHNLWIMYLSVFTLQWLEHALNHKVESAFKSWWSFIWSRHFPTFVKSKNSSLCLGKRAMICVLRQFNSIYWLTSSFSETHFSATER